MSIERTQPLKPITQVQSRGASEATKQKRVQTPTQSEVAGNQVKLSNVQARLMQPGTQDIDMNRVKTLKQAIRDGFLQVDASKIADALIKDNQDFLANN